MLHQVFEGSLSWNLAGLPLSLTQDKQVAYIEEHFFLFVLLKQESTGLHGFFFFFYKQDKFKVKDTMVQWKVFHPEFKKIKK
jgi:hypothetical protein